MRRRLYFLVPDLATAETIIDELLLARIEARHMHVVAREGTPLGDLPEADLRQKSDLIESAERGLAVGGVTGVLAGLTAVTFPPAGVVVGGGLVAGTTLAGAGFGAWAASMIGIRLPNREIRAYEDAIDAGQLLLMVDVPAADEQRIAAMVRSHHPEVNIGDTEPHKPAFP
ncbi:DUF1269 domain-containing protein [Spectribacter hydrogenoxidans]|uniref:DUF1269 domain-containing protein n=1 Tax=Spectribacter hydrogenoxidans TaxID=3075608 RepID=A0ABU3BZ94_9GAMM|nr:DUF1269 domain-containing protein [Salinisphaera sp. W335]MDT0634628.1 DUF1269 domain-containing protein [Salinisphaera sp. W335]